MPDTSNTSATRATQMQHECDTSNMSATQVRRECYTKDTSATGVRVKNFDFDNDTSKNIFSHPYIYYMASERQGESNFILRTNSWKCLVSMPKCV